MFRDDKLGFIIERIREIRSALIYSMSNELIKLPTSIISILRIDGQGQLWFLVNRPPTMLHEIDKTFPARLQFYRKHKPFFLHVAGIASIEEDPVLVKELTESPDNNAPANGLSQMMFVRLKISKVEYHEQRSAIATNYWRQAWQYICDSLFTPSWHYRQLEINTNFA